MTLESLLKKFPPRGDRWVGYIPGFEWQLEPHSLGGRRLSVTFWLSGKALFFQGLMKGETLEEAIQETILWIRQFRDSLSGLQDSLGVFAPSTALERVIEGD